MGTWLDHDTCMLIWESGMCGEGQHACLARWVGGQHSWQDASKMAWCPDAQMAKSIQEMHARLVMLAWSHFGPGHPSKPMRLFFHYLQVCPLATDRVRYAYFLCRTGDICIKIVKKKILTQYSTKDNDVFLWWHSDHIFVVSPKHPTPHYQTSSVVSVPLSRFEHRINN